MKKRIIALLLCLVLIISSQGISTLAYTVRDSQGNIIPTAGDSEDGIVLRTQNGDVPYDETWETLYPYGTFAFGNYQLDVAEGGPSEADGINVPSKIILPVYRVGGTTGKVTAKIVYAPAVSEMDEEGTLNYDFAASATKDFVISYENPLSIAAEQPIGRAPIYADMYGWVNCMPTDSSEIWKMKDYIYAITSWTLTAEDLSVGGEEVVYKWQVGSDFIEQDGKYYATVWEDIMDSNCTSIDLNGEDIWDFDSRTWKNDFRIVYKVGDTLYSPMTLMGMFCEDVTIPESMPETEEITPVAQPEYEEVSAPVAEISKAPAEAAEAAEAAEEVTEAPAEEPAETSVEAAEEVTEAPAEEPAETPVEAAEEVTEAPAEELVEEHVEESEAEAAEEITEAPAEEPAETPAETPAEAAEEVIEAPAEEPAEAPAEAAEEVTEAPAEESVEAPAEAAEEVTEVPAEEPVAGEYEGIPEYTNAFVPDEEVTYTTIDFGEEFDAYEFEITFAENEWVKNIIIEAVDDDIRELDEFGLFTITGCVGGETSSICNTCTVMISDNEAKAASEIGFEITDISCDQDAGSVELVVKRTGDTTYNVAFDYATVDGTAVEGRQYAKTQGSATLVGCVDEFTINIPLIAENVRPEELEFSVILTNMSGGLDGLCTFAEEQSVATIHLASTGALWDAESGLNLESVLARTDADEVSSNGYFEGGSLVPDSGKATGEYYSKEREDLVGEYSDSPVDMQSYTYTGANAVTFSRNNYGANMWRDYAVVVGDSSDSIPSDNTRISYTFLYPGYNTSYSKQNGDESNTVKEDGRIQMIHYAQTYTDPTANPDLSGRTNMQITVGKAGEYYSSVKYKYVMRNIAVARAGEKEKDYRYILPVTKLYQKKYMNNSSKITTSSHYCYITDSSSRYLEGSSGTFSGEFKLEPIFDVNDKNASNFIAQTAFLVATNTEYSTDHERRVNANATYELDYMYLVRRKLSQKGIGLRIYTANDADTIQGFIDHPGFASNSMDDPMYYAVLDPSSTVYQSIKPVISIVDGQGGVDAQGHLYAGSQILVTVNSVANYSLAKDANNAATYSVYLTDENGNIKGTVEQVSGNANQYKITLNNMTDADLQKTYTINVVMERKQDIVLDIAPSIQKDASGKYTAADVEAVWSMLIGDPDMYAVGNRTIYLGLATDIAADDQGLEYYRDNRFKPGWCTSSFSTISQYIGKTVSDTEISLNSLLYTDNPANIYSINFGQDHDDIILFNGRSYAGDETIYLSMADLSLARLVFHFYDSTVLENVSPMRTTIDHIELYFDANGDGVISGRRDPETGYFLVDSSKDTLILGNVVDSFADNIYRPRVGEDGKLYQYFLKVYYSANPRSLHKPTDDADEPDTAWIVPFFTSSTTQTEIRNAQTNEQNSYRYINATNLSGHPVYGPEITKVTYTDIPMGGDSSVVTSKTTITGITDRNMKLLEQESSTVYEWVPDYHGNLMFKYDNPAMINFEQNITNTPVALIEKDDINEYLGAFADNAIMGLSVKRGSESDFGAELAGNAKPESYTLGDIKSVRASLNALQMEGNKNNQQSGEAKEPDGVNDYSEYSADLGVELPSLEFEMGDYINVTMDGYTLALSVGIPVYSKEKTTYSGGREGVDEHSSNVNGAKTIERTTDGEDNSKETAIYRDAKGKTLGTEETSYMNPTERTMSDGSKIKETESTSTYTPASNSSDPSVKPAPQQVTKTRVTETVDKNGNVVSRRIVKETYDVDENGDKSNSRYSQTYYEKNSETGGYTYLGDKNEEIKVTGYVAPTTAPTQATSGTPEPTRRASTENFIAANEALSAVGQFFAGVTDRLKNGKNSTKSTGIKDLLSTDDSLEQAKGARPKSTCKSFELSVKVQLAITFEYNPISDQWCFKQAAVSASLGVEFTIKYRLTPCPIVYVYIKFEVEVEIALGLSVDKVAKYNTGIIKDMTSTQKQIDFKMLVDKGKDNGGRGFSAKFKGRMVMYIIENEGTENEKILVTGIISGDGENPTEVFFQNYKEEITVELICIEGLEAKDVTDIKGIQGAKSEVHFDGVTVNPSFAIEAGAGVGVECAHIEVCIRVNLSIELVFGGYAKNDDGSGSYRGAYMSAFDFSISLGINVTFLFFNFSMDAIGVRIHGEQDPFKASHTTWTTTVFALNDWVDPLYEKTVEYQSLEEAGDVTGEMIHKSGPLDISDSVRFANVGNDSVVDPLAYNPTDTKAPFQLSGYNTSGDAKMLVEGLTTGYSYRLFNVNDTNYILYPISMKATGTDITVTRLVLSKLVLEGQTGAASDHTLVGLQNPVDASSATPYIFVDNDETSDVEFNVDVDGTEITVAWTGYNDIADVEESSDAAGMLVVKRASIDFTEGETEFTTPVLVTPIDSVTLPVSGINVTGAALGVCSSAAVTAAAVYKSLPVQVGEYTIYAQSEDDIATQSNGLFKKYLSEKYGVTDEEFTSGQPASPASVSALYNWVTRSELNKLYGSHSNLMIQKGLEAPVKCDITGGITGNHEVIENIEATELGGNILLTYTTSETKYLVKGASGYETVTDPANITADTEQAVVRRLYTRVFDKSSDTWQTAKLVHTVVDFDSCNYENIADCELKDGYYVNEVFQPGTDMADPMFSNVRFIEAKLDGTNKETVLLYEMGGNTYIIDQTNLNNMLNGLTFSEKSVFAETTGTNVNINTDADGAMALVYTAPVKGTSNNAVYVAYWDATLNSFGAANILAMNHLQVYEDAQEFELSDEDIEKAFLGITTGNAAYEAHKAGYTDARNKGAMDSFTFGNLQMTTRTVGSGENESKQLVILTEGSMSELVAKTMNYTQNGVRGSQTVYVQDQGTAGNPKYPEVGFYAIAFGEGEQAVGEGDFELEFYSFASDDVLRGIASFTNTGTTAIRGSEMNPITLTLSASGSGYSQELATGYIHENIPAGCKGELKFISDKLTQTLPVGTTFTLEISEDAEYIESHGGKAFQTQINNLFTVESKPDLNFDSPEFKVVGIDTSKPGDERAIVEFSAYVRNTGVTNADHVFVQMTYDTGAVDEYDSPVYKCIDLTGSDIETTSQQAIMFHSVTESDLKYGIVALKSIEDSGTDIQRIKPGYERLVHGQLHIPLSCFVSTEDVSGLHLRAEIFSDADSLSYDTSTHLYSSAHAGEYRGANNILDQTISHKTIFTAPAQISMALGNTMYIPVSPKSTYVDGDIVATEIVKTGENSKLGVLYYDADMKAVVVAPGGECDTLIKSGQIPEGAIEVQDKSTNSQYSIAFKVTALGTGVNIFNDDKSFTFRNANGSETDPNAASENRDWDFVETSVWSFEGETGNIVPMNSNYVVANKAGASIEFTSVASRITVYYSGQISVSSDKFGSGDSPAANRAGASYTFNFAANDVGETHTITITALSVNTIIDRYEARYATGTNPIPDMDADKPSIYYSRSFPDPASIKTGTAGISFTAYILDAGGIASASWNGVPIETASISSDGTFWKYDITINKNGTYKLVVRDKAGNETVSTIEATWFNSVLSTGANATAPALNDSTINIERQNGSVVGTIESAAPYLRISGSLTADEELVVRSTPSANFTASEIIEAETDGRYKMEKNGYYLVQKKNNANNTWAQSIVQMNLIKLDGPTLSAMVTEDGSLVIDAKDSVGITSLTINGWEYITSTSSKRIYQTYPNVLGGEYRIVVKDRLGTGLESDTVHTKIAKVSASSIIKVNEGAVRVKPDGTICIDNGVLSGGVFTTGAAGGNEGNDIADYKADYNYAIIEVTSGAVDLTKLTAADFNSCAPGEEIPTDYASEYVLVFRDSRMDEASQAVTTVKTDISLFIPEDTIIVASDGAIHISDNRVSGGYFNATLNNPGYYVDSTGYTFPYSVAMVEADANGAFDISSVTTDDFEVITQGGIYINPDHPAKYGFVFRLGKDIEAGQLLKECEDIHVITNNGGAACTVVGDGPAFVGPGGSFTFRINISANYSGANMQVFIGEDELVPDKNGVYVIDNINYDINIDIRNVIYVGPSIPVLTPDFIKKDETTVPEQLEVEIATGATITLADEAAEFKIATIGSDGETGTLVYMGPVGRPDEEITIPGTVDIGGVTYKVTEVAENAFRNNAAIKVVNIPKNITTIDKNAFRNCNNLTKVVIGKGVKTIGASAFLGCEKLETVTIGSKVKEIGSYAFYRCESLKEIVIPASVKSIEKKAFASCTKLKTIVINSTKIKASDVGVRAFARIKSTAVFTVPESKKKACTAWIKDVTTSKKIKITVEE